MSNIGKATKESLKGYFTATVLVAAGVFFLYDIIIDLAKGSDSISHMAVEITVFTVVVLALWLEIVRVIRLRREVLLEYERAQRLSGELFQHMERTFGRWDLTHAERDIAIMLIKGLSMAEVAEARSSKEKTVRQHATNIYAKANVSNRSELASYFIEDLIQGVEDG